MNCDELVELVTDYLEDNLPAPERARFEEHLRECPGCETYLAQMRVTVGLLGELPPASLPGAVRDRLLLAFADWQASGPAPA